MTYYLCKKLILANKIDGLQDKLDVFLLNDRLTDEQYNELANLLKQQTAAQEGYHG